MSEGGVTGRDSRLTDEMIEKVAREIGFLIPAQQYVIDPMDAVNRRDTARKIARKALEAVLPLLPDEAAIRAKIADEIEAKAADAESASLRCAYPGAAGQWAHEAALLRKAARIARGSAAATEDSQS